MKNFLFLLLSVILLSSCSDYSALLEVEVKEVNGTKTVTYGEWVKGVPMLPDSVKTIYVGYYGGCSNCFPDEFLIINGKVINKWLDSNSDYEQKATVSDGKYYFNIHENNKEIDVTEGWFLIDKQKIFKHSDNKKLYKTKRVYHYYLQ